MGKSLYLINPHAAFPNYYGGEVFAERGLSPTVTVTDLAIATVAAMAPEDFDVTLCESNIQSVDYDLPVDFVGITGKNSQFKHMIEIADEFRKRGKTVIIGGPYASLDPEKVRPYCDILVVGEMEEIAEQLFSDLRAGTWKDQYTGTQPDLRKSPMPRWDLYPHEHARIGTVQTSRGCPFECEFCDVIQYLGRKQRHKDPDQVIAELDVLYDLGFRAIFLSDDNFTVYRRRAKELLEALKEWNLSRTQGHVTFITQLSIDAAMDVELLDLCAEAGLSQVFVGIETPNEESLKETRKLQNLTNSHGTMLEKIDLMVEHGMMVMGGMIVGFDHDDYTIFEKQLNFAMQTPVALFNLFQLVAPAATPLYDRMKEAGRLVDWGEEKESSGFPWFTNIIPEQMTREELAAGTKWLSNNLYSPENFGKRLLRFIELHGNALEKIPYRDTHRSQLIGRPAVTNTVKLIRHLPRMGAGEAQLWNDVTRGLSKKPWLSAVVMGALGQYMQIRYMMAVGRFWDPQLADTTPNIQEIIPTLIPAAEILGQGTAA